MLRCAPITDGRGMLENRLFALDDRTTVELAGIWTERLFFLVIF